MRSLDVYPWLLVRSAVTAAVAFSLLLAASISATADWKPERNVELIVATGTGGGADTMGRIIQKLSKDLRLVNVTMSVVNKPGGGGVIGWTYINQRAGDAHYLAITAPPLLTNHISGRSAFSYTDVTPIAQVKNEYIAFFVKADSAIESGKDLIERIKREPVQLTFNIGSSAANHNHVALALLTQAIGGELRKLKTVIFKSPGEGMAAVLGGHVDVSIHPVATPRRLVEEGKMRILAVASPQRLPGAFASVPTWRELGANAVFMHWNGVIAPGGLNREQTAFWEGVIAEATKAKDWKSYYQKMYGQEAIFMGSEATKRFLETEYRTYKDVLTDLGLASAAAAK